MSHQIPNTIDQNADLKERVRAFWQAHPCGTKFTEDDLDTPEFFKSIEEHRYEKEWHIPRAADFGSARGLSVLEIGCGVGSDGLQFAKCGAFYTGIDLTEAAVNLARRNFANSGLRGEFRVGDAENLEFPDESFDVVYSHGVLHHTPDIERAVHEIHRVLKPNGRAIVMLYHRGSYNYRIGIRMLRPAGARLLKTGAGRRLVNRLIGESIASLREHALLVKASRNGYFSSAEFLSRSTDGADNPLTRVYSKQEARNLLNQFRDLEMRTFFLNKRFIPLIGNLLPRWLESALAARWGWHLWIYARK